MSATLRDLRRLALVALFQLDAAKGESPDDIRANLDDAELMDEDRQIIPEDSLPLREVDIDKAFNLALEAWHARSAADDEMTALAPDWPTARQPAIDRAILRLAHFEMTSGRTPPKAAVNEAIELAKAFSTERSPAFVNGLLGKVLKRVLAEAAQPEPSPSEQTQPEPIGDSTAAAEG